MTWQWPFRRAAVVDSITLRVQTSMLVRQTAGGQNPLTRVSIGLILERSASGVVVAGFHAQASLQRVFPAGSKPSNHSSIEGIHDGWATILAGNQHQHQQRSWYLSHERRPCRKILCCIVVGAQTSIGFQQTLQGNRLPAIDH
jgi:hypothetical protein